MANVIFELLIINTLIKTLKLNCSKWHIKNKRVKARN